MLIELERLEEAGGRFSQVYQVGDSLLAGEEVRLVEPADVRGRIRRHGDGVELRENWTRSLKLAVIGV